MNFRNRAGLLLHWVGFIIHIPNHLCVDAQLACTGDAVVCCGKTHQKLTAKKTIKLFSLQM